jgi:hypothetical protein
LQRANIDNIAIESPWHGVHRRVRGCWRQSATAATKQR